MEGLIALGSLSGQFLGAGYNIFVFTFILGVLIFAHELGHFLVAKRLGVIVEKFSFGLGPKICGKKFGETEYLISAIPWGGYVKLLGDEPGEECADFENSFLAQSIWKRLAIVFAGPLFNFLLAVFIFTLMYMISGLPEMNSKSTQVGEIAADSPAQQAGLKKGDRIISIAQKPVFNWEELSQIIRANPGKALDFKVEREKGEELNLEIIPRIKKIRNSQGEEIEAGLIGIMPQVSYKRQLNPLIALGKSLKKSGEITYLTVSGIKKIITGDIPANTIGGPILIYMMIREQAKIGLLGLSFFVALISINLAILNLFPVPILDGGHILFFALEAIMGRPLNEKSREIANQIGLFMLISLMIFAFYNDIVRFFVK